MAALIFCAHSLEDDYWVSGHRDPPGEVEDSYGSAGNDKQLDKAPTMSRWDWT